MIIGVVKIAGHQTRPETQRSDSLGKEDRKVATRATAPVEGFEWSLRAFALADLLCDLRCDAIADVLQERQGIRWSAHHELFDPV